MYYKKKSCIKGIAKEQVHILQKSKGVLDLDFLCLFAGIFGIMVIWDDIHNAPLLLSANWT